MKNPTIGWTSGTSKWSLRLLCSVDKIHPKTFNDGRRVARRISPGIGRNEKWWRRWNGTWRPDEKEIIVMRPLWRTRTIIGSLGTPNVYIYILYKWFQSLFVSKTHWQEKLYNDSIVYRVIHYLLSTNSSSQHNM